MIQAFGDSHVHFSFCRVAAADIAWLGPVTMHRFSLSWYDILDQHSNRFRHRDTLLLMFGEIDVRCHVLRLSHRDQVAPEAVVLDLAERYVLAAKGALARFGFKRVAIASVPPPSSDQLLTSEEYPVIGELSERVAVTRLLNDLLREGARKRGELAFINYSPLVSDDAGVLLPDLSDGNVHLHPRHQDRVAQAMARDLFPIRLLPYDDSMLVPRSRYRARRLFEWSWPF